MCDNSDSKEGDGRNAAISARLWYGEPDAIRNAIGYAKHRSHSHHAVIRVYDEAGNVIETHEHAIPRAGWAKFYLA
jgi:hypothetical protein